MKKLIILTITLVLLTKSYGQLTENFDGGTFLPVGWSHEFVSATVMWSSKNGNFNSSVTAHSGTANAYFFSNNYLGNTTKLVTPVMNLSALPSAVLEFWHTQKDWGGDQDELRVYYKTSAVAPWVMIAEYINSISIWTKESITLPNLSSTYYIAFEGKSGYGYGVTLDDVTVSPPASCLEPNMLTSSNVSPTQVNLGWTETGTASSWNIEWGLNGFAQGTGTLISGTNNNPHNLAGLTAATNYQFYVQADCGGSGTSTWAGPFSFTTLCNTLNTFPFLETFENSSASRTCWSQIQELGTANWIYSNGSTGGTISTAQSGLLNAQFVSVNGTNSPITKLVSPVFDFSSLTTPQLKFYYAQQDWNGDQNTLKVYYRISPTDSWVELANDTTNVASWTLQTLILPNPSSTYQIAFEGINNWGYANVIDQVEIKEAPSCLPPSSLSVSNLTTSSVDLGWVENGSATTWDIQWGLQGFALGTGTIISGTSTNPHQLMGLNGNTTYAFYVRADCGGGDLSTWVGPFSFTTLVSCVQPSNITSLNTTSTTALIDWTENGTATTWEIQWGVTGFVLGTGVSDTTTSKPYLVTPLSPEVVYDLYIRAVCGASDSSVWIGPLTFITTCAAPTISAFPWIENFDGVTNPNIPCGWIIDNANGDFNTWEIYNSVANSTPNSLSIAYNLTESMNDWIFTPTLNLNGGQTYQLSFAFRAESATYPEKLNVMFGNGQTSIAMTQLLFDSTFNNTSFETATVLLTPITSGNYHVGFHGYSDADMWRIYLDDIILDYPTNLNTSSIHNEISIFPNPTSGLFTIQTKTDKTTTVEILNLQGKIIYKNHINNTQTIDLTNNAKGIYLVNITTTDGFEVYKIIIQ